MSELIEVKTSELTGHALDWAVAQAVSHPADWEKSSGCLWFESSDHEWIAWSPSTDWAQGGPLLDSMVIGVIHNSRIRPHPFDKGYQAMASHFIGPSEGHTILIAACRAIVAAKMGDVVQVPKLMVVK